MSSVTDEEKGLKKQIGCMNGILQLFDRHHFITGRSVSSHNHKRLLQGAERQQGPQNMKAIVEKGPEVQKEKPRISTESSRASCSSSTCSTSTFSSLECSRIAHPELRQINGPESHLQIMATKEQHPPLLNSMQSLDLRDIVKGSMYRETRSLSIKYLGTDERRGTAMKHIDSPRPSHHLVPGKPKSTGYEGSARALVKIQECTVKAKEEQLALPRFSYDEREPRETSKWSMKSKELPRLSLDSRTSSMKGSPKLEPRQNFPGYNKNTVNENSSQTLQSNQGSKSFHQSSSIVAKLMGLETLQHATSPNESRTPTARSCPIEACLSTSSAMQSRQNHNTSPRVPKSTPAALSPRTCSTNYVKKPIASSKLPMERAPWRQQDCSQGRLNMASKSRKATESAPHPSSSIYGEIEKRITKLEFKESGKDLRALKRILESMEKPGERLENQRGRRCSLEDSCSAQNSKLSIWVNIRGYNRVPTVKDPCTPSQLSSTDLMMEPAKITDKVNLSISARAPTVEISQPQRPQNHIPKNHREILAERKKPEVIPLKSNNVKDLSHHHPSSDNRNTGKTSEVERTSAGAQSMTVENCSTPGRSFGMASPRSQQNMCMMDAHSSQIISVSGSHEFKKQCNKKHLEKGYQNRKHTVKAKYLQLKDDQSSEVSSMTRNLSYQGDAASVQSESSNRQVLQTEAEVIRLAISTNTNARQKAKSASARRKTIPAFENVATTLEQPSPISVLDDTFYNEDSPSPVKKTSVDFQDESLKPGEAEWNLDNQKHSNACGKSDASSKYNQKLENMRHSTHVHSFLQTEHNKIAATDAAIINGSSNPGESYIAKVLLTSGLLKDSHFISTTVQHLPTCHLINPDIFHVLEQTEDITDLKGKVADRNDNIKLNKKLQRKIIFDIVDEILVRKINSGRYTLGNRTISARGLLKEVYLEIDRLCRISDCNSYNAEDAVSLLLTADILYQSEDWIDYSGEFPALVLNIERQMFKDLINEVVIGEVTGFQEWPRRHCRQLFGQ